MEGSRVRSRTAEDWLRLAKRQAQEGELFQAYDLARRGLAQFPHDPALKHYAVVCLASTNATQQAIELFGRLGLDAPEDELGPLTPRLRVDIAALKGRLRKDSALAVSGEAARHGLQEAAELYESCYRQAAAAANPDYYPAINAATLWLLAGNRDAAAGLAREVLALLDGDAGEPGYYELVSAAEAHLVLGDPLAALPLLTRARQRITGTEDTDYRALAGTIRQLRLVVEANRIDLSTLAEVVPPRVLHYCGHLIARPGRAGRFPADREDAVRRQIEDRLDAANVGFAYGSLAAGADILFAEAVLRRGASLHLVLPFGRREFVKELVRPSGRDWVARFDACLGAASSVRYATHDRYLGDDQLFSYCSQLAMGLALLRAQFLGTEATQMAVWDGAGAGGLGGTAVDIATWRHSGREPIVIDPGSTRASAPVPPPPSGSGRRTRAMLFGDIHGFSKLTDSQLPPFVDAILGAFAKVIAGYGKDVLLANTWGDGLFLVFDDAGKAAACALDLQEAVGRLDLKAAGLPETMGLRLGGHLGPVYTAHDPVLDKDNFFGAHVSRAARIEPVTPEKCVYVTETLAAVLALHNAGQFACDYVGMTPAAKHYGKMRMFLLRRAATSAGKSTGP